MDSTLWNALAGGLLIPFLQILKRSFHLSGNAMRWVTVLSALTAGLLWSVLTRDGGLTEIIQDPQVFLLGSGSILGLASLIYGIVKDKMGLSED